MSCPVPLYSVPSCIILLCPFVFHAPCHFQPLAPDIEAIKICQLAAIFMTRFRPQKAGLTVGQDLSEWFDVWCQLVTTWWRWKSGNRGGQGGEVKPLTALWNMAIIDQFQNRNILVILQLLSLCTFVIYFRRPSRPQPFFGNGQLTRKTHSRHAISGVHHSTSFVADDVLETLQHQR